MLKINASDARADLADLVSRVNYSGERVVLTRYRKPLAALVSVKDLELIQMIEDRVDIEEARKVLEESSDRIPFDEIRQKLNL